MFAVPIPEQDRERIKALRVMAARGRAADSELRGFLDGLLIGFGVDTERRVPLKLTDEEVFVLDDDTPADA